VYVYTFSFQTFTIFFLINAFINVYYNFFDVYHIYDFSNSTDLSNHLRLSEHGSRNNYLYLRVIQGASYCLLPRSLLIAKCESAKYVQL